MENSSPSPTLPASPITYQADSFSPGWTILTAIAAAIIFFVVVIVGLGFWIGVHGLNAPTLNKALLGMFGIALQSAGEIAVILFLVVVLPPLAKSSLSGLGFRKPRAADTGPIIAAIVGMLVIVTALSNSLGAALHFKTPELAVEVFTSMQGWQKVLFAIFAVVIGPIWEEFVFRVFLFNAMQKWWGFWPGAIVSSLLFGLAHAQPPFVPAMFIALSLPLAAGGIILCAVYARTGSAWSNLITHASFNGLSLLLLTVAPQLAK